ncbi:ATP-dependent helicase fft3 [Smittium mucronatum]|uniref:ATP-dependent helicase fft3 n=1 Tax=Smittium mucronatum TaxID=133383 RepID=A0A1R0H9D1_9FUNG|nr:ATP-dependent helicase fft3 [Smittium mucronatum]
MSSEDLIANKPNFFVLGTPKRNQKVNSKPQNSKEDKVSDKTEVVLESSPITPSPNSKKIITPIKALSADPDALKSQLLSFRDSIQKFKSEASIVPQNVFNSQPDKKRKLVRRIGRRSSDISTNSDTESVSTSNTPNSLPQTSLIPSKNKLHPPKKQPRLNSQKPQLFENAKSLHNITINSDEDEDGHSYLEKVSLIDAERVAVKFFNKSKKDLLTSQTGCSEQEADLIIQSRPYRNYETMENIFRKTKGLRVSIVNQYHDIVIGLAEIDQVINKCGSLTTNLNDSLVDFGLKFDPLSGKVSRINDAFIPPQSSNINPEFSLKSYQLEGVSWLQCLYNSKASGILADEMGLGKTFQVIAFLTNLKDIGVTGPHLIICPTSTLDNWLKEFSKFSPKLKIKCYYGNQDERRRMAYKIEKRGVNFDVLLSTYNVATSNKTDRALLKKVAFKSLILDEGHMIKNCTSARYTHLMQIKSLLAFILPKVFDEFAGSLHLAFKTKKPAPKPASQSSNDPDSQNQDSPPETTVPSSLSPIEHQHIKKAQKLLAPFVLRRRKVDVLKDLPKKIENLERVVMTESQSALYHELLNHHNKMIEISLAEKQKPSNSPSILESVVIADDEPLTNLAELGDKHLDPKKIGSSDGNANFSSSWIGRVSDLRKVCNHPLLVRSFYNDVKLKEMASLLLKEQDYEDAVYEYVYEDMKYCSDFELNGYCERYKKLNKFALPSDSIFDSAKVIEIKKLLDETFINNEKVLIFSQFTTVLDILEKVLKKWKKSYCRLDGSTKTDERQEMIENFNDDSDLRIFLLSTKAGGFGINLASANVVIIHDIDVNPHNDKQAEDRAHRVGQTKNVNVIKLVAKDSVEEDILKAANAKLILDDNISNAHLLDAGV